MEITRPIVGIENRTAQEVFDIMCDRIKREAAAEARATELEAQLAALKAKTLEDEWQDMSTAPTDGKHVILAVKSGPFVWDVQGAFMNGKWMNAADIKTEPLCWRSRRQIPDRFLPWTEEFQAARALRDEIGGGE